MRVQAVERQECVTFRRIYSHPVGIALHLSVPYMSNGYEVGSYLLAIFAARLSLPLQKLCQHVGVVLFFKLQQRGQSFVEAKTRSKTVAEGC